MSYFNYCRPVLITDALKGWKANEWNRDFFQKNYGDQQVVMKAVHVCILLLLYNSSFIYHSFLATLFMWKWRQNNAYQTGWLLYCMYFILVMFIWMHELVKLNRNLSRKSIHQGVVHVMLQCVPCILKRWQDNPWWRHWSVKTSGHQSGFVFM